MLSNTLTLSMCGSLTPNMGSAQYLSRISAIVSQGYLFEPSTGKVTAVADGCNRANGSDFLPRLKTAYITDTGVQLLRVIFNDQPRYVPKMW